MVSFILYYKSCSKIFFKYVLISYSTLKKEKKNDLTFKFVIAMHLKNSKNLKCLLISLDYIKKKKNKKTSQRGVCQIIFRLRHSPQRTRYVVFQ